MLSPNHQGGTAYTWTFLALLAVLFIAHLILLSVVYVIYARSRKQIEVPVTEPSEDPLPLCSEQEVNYVGLPVIPANARACFNPGIPYITNEEDNPNRAYYIGDAEDANAGYLLTTLITEPDYACASICADRTLNGEGRCISEDGKTDNTVAYSACLAKVTSAGCQGALPMATLEYGGSQHNFFVYAVGDAACDPPLDL